MRVTRRGSADRSALARMLGACVLGGLLAGCASDSTPAERPAEPAADPAPLLLIPDAQPGDLVGLVADDDRRTVSWVHRRDGTIHELAVDEPDAAASVVATIPVGTDSQQGGLLDQVLVGPGRRVLAFTSEDGELLFSSLLDGELTTVWNAGPAGNGAIGGKVTAGPGPGSMTMSVGRNVEWFSADFPVAFTDVDADVDADADADASSTAAVADQGAVLTIADTPSAGSLPTIVSFGYTNPWATAVLGDEIWVWDNAAGPDPDDPEVDDVERIGRADLVPDRRTMTRSDVADRAPADMVELPDGRLGVCGFLDNELRAYEIVDGPDDERSALERAGTIMPCNTGAAVFDDGTIVTAAQTVDGEALLILRP